jgi:hypothetical protein
MAKRFDAERLARARATPLADAVVLLGYYSKADSTFEPVKDERTERWHVSVGAQIVEMLVTGEKWFVPSENKGGGGAIDLAMYLAKVDFVEAVKRLAPQ